ncbi:hypothetical protein Mgra_00009950, partial [Meloidogyne graminicola]
SLSLDEKENVINEKENENIQSSSSSGLKTTPQKLVKAPKSGYDSDEWLSCANPPPHMIGTPLSPLTPPEKKKGKKRSKDQSPPSSGSPSPTKTFERICNEVIEVHNARMLNSAKLPPGETFEQTLKRLRKEKLLQKAKKVRFEAKD